RAIALGRQPEGPRARRARRALGVRALPAPVPRRHGVLRPPAPRPQPRRRAAHRPDLHVRVFRHRQQPAPGRDRDARWRGAGSAPGAVSGPMSAWHEGRVVENRHWTEALFSLWIEGAPLSFEAGQFVRIALDIDGERVARAFSMVNAPAEPLLEFYGIVVPQG